jgi:hypothetical protein
MPEIQIEHSASINEHWGGEVLEKDLKGVSEGKKREKLRK